MSKDKPVKYQYALNSKGEILPISDLENTKETRRDIYRCISCEKLLRPVLGEVRQRHFRHIVEANCSPETYLHQLAKRLFAQVYRKCLETESPFYAGLYEKQVCTSCNAEFGITCELKPKYSTFDLTKLFPHLSIEIPDGDFIPDILLSNGKGINLYIEFVVSHASSEEKRSSGTRIIEIRLENESDLDPIINRVITQEDENIDFLNFKTPTKLIETCPSCNKELFFFMLKKDGRAYILVDTISKYRKRLCNGDIAFSELMPQEDLSYYAEEVEKAYHAKRKVFNCYLCRYHGENIYRNENEGPIYCRFLKKKYVSTQAANCEYYRPDPKVFPSQKKLF
ncbi:MAG: hypothetical protein ABFD24_11005 [Anaerolineaceae bacterium]